MLEWYDDYPYSDYHEMNLDWVIGDLESIGYTVTQMETGKQDKLIAGANIQIAADGKTISATDTTYTAGTNITISPSNVISATGGGGQSYTSEIPVKIGTLDGKDLYEFYYTGTLFDYDYNDRGRAFVPFELQNIVSYYNPGKLVKDITYMGGTIKYTLQGLEYILPISTPIKSLEGVENDIYYSKNSSVYAEAICQSSPRSALISINGYYPNTTHLTNPYQGASFIFKVQYTIE